MQLKRVVVTGIGAITPIGNTASAYWESLLQGKSSAVPITHFDVSKFKTRFACEVQGFDPMQYFSRKDARKYDRYAQFGLVAATEAVEDAGLLDEGIDRNRVGVIWASGIGGIQSFHSEVENFVKGDGTPRYNPFFIPKMIADIAAGHISIKFEFRGPNFATVSACASSTNALADAYNYIRLGKADAFIAEVPKLLLRRMALADLMAYMLFRPATMTPKQLPGLSTKTVMVSSLEKVVADWSLKSWNMP